MYACDTHESVRLSGRKPCDEVKFSVNWFRDWHALVQLPFSSFGANGNLALMASVHNDWMNRNQVIEHAVYVVGIESPPDP